MLQSALKAWLQIGLLDQLGYLNFRKVREQIVRKSAEFSELHRKNRDPTRRRCALANR
jgi:hypothetical protein